MKIIYECEHCHKQFNDNHQCSIHELSHFDKDEGVRYYIRNIIGSQLCEYCEYAYYVYGIELNCVNKNCGPNNNYKNFKLKGV